MGPFARILVSAIALASIAGITPPPSVEAAGAADDGRKAALALYREGRTDEAIEAFDALLEEKPDDGRLKTWRGLAVLEKVKVMKLRKESTYKDIVASTFSSLRYLAQTQRDNPDWYLAMAKAWQLNDRPHRAKSALNRAIFFRKEFPEARMLLADLLVDESETLPPHGPGGMTTSPRAEKLKEASMAYRAVLDLPDLSPPLRSEALYKSGDVAARLDENRETVRGWWEKAFAAAPDSACGRIAGEKLKEKP